MSSTDEHYEAPEQDPIKRRRANLISNAGMALSALPVLTVLPVAFRIWQLGSLEWIVWVGALPVAFTIFFGGLAFAKATDKPYTVKVQAGKLAWLQEHYGTMFTEQELGKLADYGSVDKVVDGVQQTFRFSNGGTRKTMRTYRLTAHVERQDRSVPVPKPAQPTAVQDGQYHAQGAEF